MSGQQDPPPGNDSGNSPKPSRSPRKDRNQSNNGLWYLIAIGLIAAVAISVAARGRSGEKMSYSEVMKKLSEGTLNTSQMYEVSMSQTALTWQYPSRDDAMEGKGGDLKRFHVPLIGISDVSRAKLEDKLNEKGIQFYGTELPSDLVALLPMLLLTAMLVGAFIFVLRRIGGTGSAMSFGRSRGRLYAQEDVHVTFNDVAGIDEAVEELKEVVEFLKTPQKYQALGGRIPRGVLLVGPPGTGKTMLAKAVAGEAGVPFFGLSGSDFVEMYVGVGAARVRDMFQQALQRAPAIIFIDELDALGKVRQRCSGWSR